MTAGKPSADPVKVDPSADPLLEGEDAGAGRDSLRGLIAGGLSPEAAEAIVSIDLTLRRIRRSMARRELGRLAIRDLDLRVDLPDLDILAILDSAAQAEEVTVGAIADRLGIDPSRASRIAADAVAKGLARRIASQADARRICLTLTEEGAAVARAMRDYRWTLFAGTLKEWSESDLLRFAELFERFSHWVGQGQGRRG